MCAGAHKVDSKLGEIVKAYIQVSTHHPSFSVCMNSLLKGDEQLDLAVTSSAPETSNLLALAKGALGSSHG